MSLELLAPFVILGFLVFAVVVAMLHDRQQVRNEVVAWAAAEGHTLVSVSIPWLVRKFPFPVSVFDARSGTAKVEIRDADKTLRIASIQVSHLGTRGIAPNLRRVRVEWLDSRPADTQRPGRQGDGV